MLGKIGRELLSWGKIFIGVFAVMTIIQRFVVAPVRVEGMSMYPTLYDGDGTILWMLDYKPELFDIVVFRQSKNNYYVKRIIGLPGQHIKHENNQLFIDGKLVDEPYISDEFFIGNFTLEEVCQFDDCSTIPEGYYFVLGDNRLRSKDSREIGLISEEQILGKVVWRHWPLSNFGNIENHAD